MYLILISPPSSAQSLVPYCLYLTVIMTYCTWHEAFSLGIHYKNKKHWTKPKPTRQAHPETTTVVFPILALTDCKPHYYSLLLTTTPFLRMQTRISLQERSKFEASLSLGWRLDWVPEVPSNQGHSVTIFEKASNQIHSYSDFKGFASRISVKRGIHRARK